MQLNTNLLLKILICIIVFVFIILLTCLLVAITKIKHIKRRNNELLEGIACKDCIINEFTKIRHEYNNILQTITCLIEAEDVVGLQEYKSIYMNQVHLLNANSITQMVKIKDINILRLIYKLFLNAKEDGITLIITIYNIIADQNINEDEIYYVLKDCLINAYQSDESEAILISLKISSNDNGLCFTFENRTNIESEAESRKHFSQPLKARKYHTKNNFIYNTFYKNSHFIQEVQIISRLSGLN